MSLTKAKKTGQDEGDEQQNETDDELRVLANDWVVWLVRRSVPEIVKRRSRHVGNLFEWRVFFP